LLLTQQDKEVSEKKGSEEGGWNGVRPTEYNTQGKTARIRPDILGGTTP
jgi:hypothetical protein